MQPQYSDPIPEVQHHDDIPEHPENVPEIAEEDGAQTQDGPDTAPSGDERRHSLKVQKRSGKKKGKAKVLRTQSDDAEGIRPPDSTTDPNQPAPALTPVQRQALGDDVPLVMRRYGTS